jgi:hypothetical protein
MPSLFKGQRDEVKTETIVPSSVQTPPVSECPEKAVSKEFLDSLGELSTRNGVTVIRHGARLAVVSHLLVAVLKDLPPAMQADIAKSFRGRIEVLMSLGDDKALPQQYQAALLDEVNLYLKALG